MTGFPTLPTRDDFGPDYEDAYPPENPKTDFGADAVNLLLHQVTGLGLVQILSAVVVAYWDTTQGAFVILRQEEAWNTRHAQAHPTLARTSAGLYTYTFPSTVLDRSGASVPFSITAAYGKQMANQGHTPGGSPSAAVSVAGQVVTLNVGADNILFSLEVM